MNHQLNDPIAALRDELASVSPSPVFADRVRERIADDLEPLRAELQDLTASPEFAVRVRERIEAGQGRGFRASWSLFDWRLLVPAAGLAALIAAVILWPRQAPEPRNTVARVDPVAPVVPPAVTSSTPRVTPPATVARRLVAASDPARRRGPASEAGSSDAAAPRDPMLEVITDQPALLRAFRPSLGQSGATVDATEPSAMYQPQTLTVTPIEVVTIPAYVVPDLTRLPVGISPFILRITADSAERSSR